MGLAKLPKLCDILDDHLLALNMDCKVLKFMYMQRAFVILVVGGFCSWIFSSLAYFLSFGNAAMDKPEFADMLAQHEQNMAASRQPPGGLPPQGQMGPAGGFLGSVLSPQRHMGPAGGFLGSVLPS